MSVLSELVSKIREFTTAAEGLDSKMGLEEFAKTVLEQYHQVTRAEGGSFYIREGSSLVLFGSLDPGHADRSIELPLRSGRLLSKAAQMGAPLLVSEIENEADVVGSQWSGYTSGSSLLLPLLGRNGEIVGIICLHNKPTKGFTKRDLEIGTILAALIKEPIVSSWTKTALNESEERYREVFEHSSSGILLIDVTPDLRFRYAAANPAVERMAGVSAEQANGQFVEDVLPRPTSDQVIANYRRCVETGLPITVDALIDLPTGRKAASTTIIPIRDSEGRIHRLIALPIDYTEQYRAEEALKESETMYREVFENTSDGIFLLDVTSDRRFRIATANPAMERIVGLTIAESEGKFIEDILTPKTAGTVMTYHRRCLETGEPVGFDEELEFPAGRLFLQTMLVPVRDEGGRIHRIIGVSRDVTTATLARRALQQSEEKFSKAFHASPDSISISRAVDGVIIDINRGFEEINGYTREEAIGRSTLPGDLGIWADGDERKRFAELVRTAGEVTGFEATLRRRDGSLRYGVLSSRLVVIDGEQCLLTITRDLTERKRMEEAIRESEARYREIFENTSDGIFVVEVSTEGRFRLLSINPAQEKMLGVTAAETVGKFNDEFLPEEIAKIVNEDNRLCMEAEHPTRFERTLHLSSESRCFSTTLVPVRDANERIARIIGVTRDITEQKRAEEREKEHERQLFQAAKLASLGTLVSGIAHEINNPNNFIRLNSQNLREFWPDIRSSLDEMDQSGDGIMIHGIPFGAARTMVDDLINGIEEGSIRIERLLIDLRNFARGDEGELTESVDLNSVIDSAVMITRDLVRKATDSFLVEKAPRLPLVQGNYHQLEQVLINLLTNACQALPLRERGVRVSTLVEEAEGWVVLQVSDEGIGIPISTIPHVTDPFFTTKQAGGGTGLGLAVSSRIVANHGGSMDFDSEVDKGTVATVRLPFAGGRK